MWTFSFVVPCGTSYFPLGPPLRGKIALRAVRLFKWALCLWSLGGLSIILGLCPKGLKPSNSLFKGAIRAYGLSIAAMAALPANSGPASDDLSQSP